MNILDYKNKDGTFTSPKNGKVYMSEKAFNSHLHFRRTELFHNVSNLHTQTRECNFCNATYGISHVTTHEKSCYLNPVNIKCCEVCNKPIKNYKTSKGTCSKSCANTRFKTGENNGNWKQGSYRSTCFLYHAKECVVCKESNIVEVHHLDEDNTNNNPENLIPLCPTHHQYWHSKHKHIVEQAVNDYVQQWIIKLGVV